MRTLFSVLFCLFVAAPLVNAQGPPNPTASDALATRRAGRAHSSITPRVTANTAFGFNALFYAETAGRSTTRPSATVRSAPTPRASPTRPAASMRSLQHHGCLQHGQRRLCARLQHHGLLQHGQRHRSALLQHHWLLQHGQRRRGALVQHHGLLQHGQRLLCAPPTPRAPTTRPAARGALLQHHGHQQHGQRRPALLSNTTGFYNTASGVHALRRNTIGYGNTADGYAALYGNTTGVYNTGVGYHTFLRNPAGQRNTALGWGAGSFLTSGSNNIYLGHPGVASESATLRLGNVQTRAFIKGVVGVPISGLHVTINAAGQLGVAPSSERYKQDIAPLAAARESEGASASPRDLSLQDGSQRVRYSMG